MRQICNEFACARKKIRLHCGQESTRALFWWSRRTIPSNGNKETGEKDFSQNSSYSAIEHRMESSSAEGKQGKSVWINTLKWIYQFRQIVWYVSKERNHWNRLGCRPYHLWSKLKNTKFPWIRHHTNVDYSAYEGWSSPVNAKQLSCVGKSSRQRQFLIQQRLRTVCKA